MRRIAPSLLLLALLFVALALPARSEQVELDPGGSFFDDDGNLHEGSIEAIAGEGITRGCGEPDLYCPDSVVTRGQMAAFLVRSFGLAPSDDDPFADDDGGLFESDVAALAAAGVTRGCGPGRFCPRQPVTRGELAAFLNRAMSLEGHQADFFVDDNDSVFEDDIEALATAGITRGCNPPRNDRFCPREVLQRDEMAALLSRALDLPIPAIPSRPSMTLAFTGDLLIHPQVWRRAATYGSPYDFSPMFAPVADLLQEADLAICHLEVPLAHDNRNLSGYPTFNAPRQLASAVAGAGYHGCSTASNHSYDQGEAGIASTLTVLEEAGLSQAGMAARGVDSGRATTYRVGEATVAHLSATWWLNGFRLPSDKPWLVQALDVDDLLSQAAAARTEGADIVVVSLHCCVEYRVEPTAYQREVTRQLIASPDVDLVVGHHAHVVQPIEEVDGEYIVYGLGNFLSAQRLRPATQDGVIVQVEFAPRGDRWLARQVGAHPTWVEDGSYRILPSARYNPASWSRTYRALSDGASDGLSVVR